MLEKRLGALALIVMVVVYLLLAQAVMAARFPGKGKIKVIEPPAAGQSGEMMFFFKAFKNVENLTVTFMLPAGCREDGDKLIRKIGAVPMGKMVRVSCRFKAENMGIFRVGAMANAYDEAMSGGNHTWYTFFEAGLAEGYADIIKPYNEWQKRTTAEPTRDEFVEVVRNVFKSKTRAADDRGNVFELDRFPVLPTVGDVYGRFVISGPPLIHRKVNMRYEVEVRENLGRRNSPVELVMIFPPNAFRIEDVKWPEGGDYELIERGLVWRGLLPGNRQKIAIEAKVTAQRPGEGKIRALFKVRGRRGEYTTETPLYLEVNHHSARVYNSEAKRAAM